MRRLVLLLLAVVAVGVAGGGAALADSGHQHLGAPDQIRHGAGTWSNLWVPTDACNGFAAGGALSFGSIDYRMHSRLWADEDWFEVSWKINGSVVAGGSTYEIRGDVLYSNFSSWYDNVLGQGQVRIRRSDNARMAGEAVLYWNDETMRHEIQWSGTPVCS